MRLYERSKRGERRRKIKVRKKNSLIVKEEKDQWQQHK